MWSLVLNVVSFKVEKNPSVNTVFFLRSFFAFYSLQFYLFPGCIYVDISEVREREHTDFFILICIIYKIFEINIHNLSPVNQLYFVYNKILSFC